MRQSSRWSFYFVSTGISNVRQMRIPGFILIVCILLGTAGIIGFSRAAYFLSIYAYTRFGLYNERIENRELKEKMRFLGRLADTYSLKMKNLVAFEDNARLKFGMNTIGEDIRLAGVGGPPSYDHIVGLLLQDPVIRDADNLEKKFVSLLNQVSLQDSTFSRMSNHVIMQNDRWAQMPSIWPCRGRITSGFGYRYHPFLGGTLFHEGIDIANHVWTPIFATGDGIVSSVGFSGNYGNAVKVNHRGSGYYTVYAHLQQSAVVEGQVVKRGELVGYLGSSGRSTGPHLHYEIRKFNAYENPMKYILPMDYIVD